MSVDSPSLQLPPRRISTPWGSLEPVVDLLPLVYLLVLYGIVYFLPFGVFEGWRKGEDGPCEWLQFLGYAGASLCSFAVAWRRRRHWFSLPFLAWILLGLFCFLMAGEEISWGERLTGVGVEGIRQINAQGETTVHNIPAVQGLMHFAFILFGIFFGYLGWRFLPAIDALPARRFSLYFLPVALFYAYFDLSWITHGDRIRNDQEAIEV
ncbi:MAG: pectate lyase, partial [Cyanobium sp.]